MCAHRAVLRDLEWGVERESNRNGGVERIGRSCCLDRGRRCGVVSEEG